MQRCIGGDWETFPPPLSTSAEFRQAVRARDSLRRPTTAAAAAPNRISIGGAGTSWPPVLVEVDPPEDVLVDDDEDVEDEVDDDVEVLVDEDELVEVDELDEELVLVDTLPELVDTLPDVVEVDDTLPDVEEMLPELVVVVDEVTLPDVVELTFPEVVEDTLPDVVDVTLPEVLVDTLPDVVEVETLPDVVELVLVTLPDEVDVTVPPVVVPPVVVDVMTTLPPPPLLPPPKNPPKKPPPKPPMGPPPITTGPPPPPPEYDGPGPGTYGGGIGTMAICCGWSQQVRLMILRTRRVVRGSSLRTMRLAGRFTVLTGAAFAIFNLRYSVLADWVSATWTAPPPMIAQPAAQADNFARAIRTDIMRCSLCCAPEARRPLRATLRPSARKNAETG